MTIALPPLYHVGMVVPDVDAAAAAFERRHGVELAKRFDVDVRDALFDGGRASFSARYAFLPLGNTDIELIQPLAGDSPYSRFLQEGGEGIHHLAFVVGSIEEHLGHLRETSPGCSIVLDATVLDGALRFVYVDGAAHGAVLELIEGDPEGDEQLGA